MKLIQDLDIKPGDRIILRCDLNLPQDSSGKFTDFFRLESSLPTIEYLKDLGASIFIISHLGSPKGKNISGLSLKQLAPLISEAINKKVEFVADPFDPKNNLANHKGIFLLENLRFWEGEEAASLDFAKDLVKSTGAELFIQDAFGASHRNHTSLTCLPRLISSGAGLLLQKEIASLNITGDTGLTIIVGGAKVESKLPVVSNFIARADNVLTGGVVANTFLKAVGKNISSSLFSEQCVDLAASIYKKAKETKTTLLLPEDYICAKSPDDLLAEEFSSNNIQPGQMILDLGSKSLGLYKDILAKSKTVIWAGTLGFAEKPTFSGGSKQILQELISLKQKNNTKIIIGGGDSVDFVRDQLRGDQLSLIDHLSTGGGASLQMLSGQTLPGIKALDEIPTTGTSMSLRGDLGRPELQLASKSPVLVANLKSNFDLEESKSWFEQVTKSETLTSPNLELIIAPSNLFLEELSSDIKSINIKRPPKIFAQDISSNPEGPETGEVAASQLVGMASGVIIGHSERRINHHEDDETIFKKIVMATRSNLEVILCVGSMEDDASKQKRAVYMQLKGALDNLNSHQLSLISIAYEPVFAIGSGKVPSIEFLNQQLTSIKEFLEDRGQATKVLYGGSVNSGNSKAILDLGFDGLMVGSAALKVESLESISININA